MSKPWEKYQKQKKEKIEPSEKEGGEKPWEKYQRLEIEKNKPAPYDPPRNQMAEEYKPVYGGMGGVGGIINPNDSQAALEGFGQAASFGLLPQVQAIAEPVQSKLTGFLHGENIDVPWKQMIPGSAEYIKARDENIKRIQQESEASPISYGAGSLGGMIVGGAAPAGLIGKAGLAGAKAAAASGALSGALETPIAKEGEEAGFDLAQRAKQGLIGGALGFGAEKAIQGAKKIGKAIAEAPGDLADALAFRSLGAFKKDSKRLLKKGLSETSELGRFARKEGLVKGGDDIVDVVDRTVAKRSEIGQKIGDIYKNVQSKIGKKGISLETDPVILARKAEALVSQKFTGTPGGEAAIKRVAQELENLRNLPQGASFLEVNKFRQGLDDLIRFDQDKPTQEALRTLRGFLKGYTDDVVRNIDKQLQTRASQELVDLNKRYSKVSEAYKIAKDRLAADKANNIFSLTDKIFGASGMTIGAVKGLEEGDVGKAIKYGALGAGAGLASRGARRLGAPLAMSTMGAVDDAGRAISKFLSETGTKITPDVVKGFIDRYGPELTNSLLASPALRGSVIGQIGAKQ